MKKTLATLTLGAVLGMGLGPALAGAYSPDPKQDTVKALEEIARTLKSQDNARALQDIGRTLNSIDSHLKRCNRQ